MKIWFTEIGEPLPFEKDVRLHRYGTFTQLLTKLGHEVTWWTSTFSHAKKAFVFSEDCERDFNGVKIKFIHGPGYRRNISVARFRHQADFSKKFYELARESKDKPDLIVSPIPTLEVANLAARLGVEFNVPVVTDIRDEWPEEFVDLAPKPIRPFAKLLLNGYFKRIDYICRNVQGIIGVSERQLNYGLKYAKRAQNDNDGVFPQGYSPDPLDAAKIEAATAWWTAQGVRKSAFVCCFFGTIGKFFNIETVIKAARILEKDLDIQFVICGDGSSLPQLKKLAADTESVIFPGWVDGPQISSLMVMSKVGLAPYLRGSRMSLPNKPFEYFAGGLAVVSSIDGELTRILKDNDCGITYSPDSADELADALRTLYNSPEKCREMGQRARKLLEDEYATQKIAERMSQHFSRVVHNFGAKNA